MCVKQYNYVYIDVYCYRLRAKREFRPEGGSSSAQSSMTTYIGCEIGRENRSLPYFPCWTRESYIVTAVLCVGLSYIIYDVTRLTKFYCLYIVLESAQRSLM